MALDIDTVFRDHVVKGDIHSGANEPDKAEIRALLKALTGASSSPAVVKQTKAALDLVTPASETYGGMVLNDPDPTKNGLYYRSSATWVKGRGFPDTFASAAFSGTSSAQTMTLEAGVNPADVLVYFGSVTTENTGALTLDGIDVVNAAGNALSAGEWTGTVLFFLNGDGDYQLLFAAGAVVASAQSATDAAASATEATNQVAGVIPSLQRFAVGDAVQSADLGNMELHPNSVRVFIEGVYQFSDTWDLTDGALTPVGGTWPGDGIVENMEVVIDATSAIVFNVPSNGSVTRQKIADEAVGEDEIDAELLEELRHTAEVSGLFTNAVGPVPSYVPGAASTRTLMAGETFNGGDPKYHRHFGGIVRDRHGRVHIIYRRATEHGVGVPGVICQITLANEGRGAPSPSDERVIVPAITGRDQRDCNIGITPDGDLIITYADVSQDGVDPTVFKTIYSTDDSENWSSPAVFETFDVTYARPYGSIKVVPSDNPDYDWRLEQPAYYRIGTTSEYVCALYYSYDGRTWTEGTPIFSGEGGYNETEVAWLNREVGFAVSRASGLNWWVTTNAGQTWSGPNIIPAASVSNAVAPSLNVIFSDGTPYCLLGWCDRTTDETKWAAARCEDLMTNGDAFSNRVTITSSNDMINASGYQRPLIYPNGRMLFVEFKEYLTPDSPWSDVRLVQANTVSLLPRLVADMRFGGSSSGLDDTAPLKVITRGSGSAGAVGYSATGSSRPIWHFENPNGPVGSISLSGTATAFNTSSDGGLKVDRVPIEDEINIDVVWAAVEPLAYTMLSGRDMSEVDGRWFGLIAQDLYEVWPQAVTPGWGVPGQPGYVPWAIDYSKIVPLLIARQKQFERRANERLTTLEGTVL